MASARRNSMARICKGAVLRQSFLDCGCACFWRWRVAYWYECWCWHWPTRWHRIRLRALPWRGGDFSAVLLAAVAVTVTVTETDRGRSVWNGYYWIAESWCLVWHVSVTKKGWMSAPWSCSNAEHWNRARSQIATELDEAAYFTCLFFGFYGDFVGLVKVWI